MPCKEMQFVPWDRLTSRWDSNGQGWFHWKPTSAGIVIWGTPPMLQYPLHRIDDETDTHRSVQWSRYIFILKVPPNMSMVHHLHHDHFAHSLTHCMCRIWLFEPLHHGVSRFGWCTEGSVGGWTWHLFYCEHCGGGEVCVCVCEMIRAFVHWDGSDGGTAAAAGGGGEYGGGGGGGRLLLGRLGDTSLPASARVLLMSACWWWWWWWWWCLAVRDRASAESLHSGDVRRPTNGLREDCQMPQQRTLDDGFQEMTQPISAVSPGDCSTTRTHILCDTLACGGGVHSLCVLTTNTITTLLYSIHCTLTFDPRLAWTFTR